MTASHEDRIRRANAALLGEGDLEAVDEAFAADYVAHVRGRKHRGRAFVRIEVRERN